MKVQVTGEKMERAEAEGKKACLTTLEMPHTAFNN